MPQREVMAINSLPRMVVLGAQLDFICYDILHTEYTQHHIHLTLVEFKDLFNHVLNFYIKTNQDG